MTARRTLNWMPDQARDDSRRHAEFISASQK